MQRPVDQQEVYWMLFADDLLNAVEKRSHMLKESIAAFHASKL
ncbi:hypothetical protein [Leptolyngbya sp. FACHB-321]|nr:hypothetical protein [Leptolyngbya sp. FACHB-321]